MRPSSASTIPAARASRKACCRWGRLRRYFPAQRAGLGRRAANLRHHWAVRRRRRLLTRHHGPYVSCRQHSQPLAPGGLTGQQERAGEFASATQLKCSEILVPVAIRHVGILHFPLSQVEQILLRDLPLFCPFAQMGPLLPWQPLPLNLGHVSTAEYQRSEFIDQSVLLIRIVVGKILLQSSEEIPLAILPAFQPDANQRGDRLAHARIDRLGEASPRPS